MDCIEIEGIEKREELSCCERRGRAVGRWGEIIQSPAAYIPLTVRGWPRSGFVKCIFFYATVPKLLTVSHARLIHGCPPRTSREWRG